MSNFNKVITNIPVPLTETEISNLSQTLSGIVQGGGGGGEGKTYNGDGVYVTVNNDTNPGVINLTQTTKDKLNRPIPSAVADLTDADEYATKSFVAGTYQTIAGMNDYQTKDDMSAYLTKASASQNLAPISVTADIETLKAASGDFTQYYKKTETSSKEQLYTEFAKYQLSGNYVNQSDYNTEKDAIWLKLQTLDGTKQNTLDFDTDEHGNISAINDIPLAGQGGTTYSAGQYINIDTNDTISVTGVVAIDNTSAYDPILLGDANITAVSSRTNNRTTWNLSVNATPVVTDTKLTGDNCVTAHTTETSGEWAVGLVQSAYQAIDSVGGIATDVGTLKTASGNWDKVSDKLDTTAFSTVSGTFLTTIPDTYATKEYANNASANALSEAKTWVGQQGYIKQETDWTNTIQEASAKAYNDATANANSLYQTKGDYVKNTDIGLDANNKVTAISGKELIITAHQSLTNYYTKDETSGAAQISAAFAALPGGGITEVTHDTTLTGKGNSTQNLGVAWSALSSNTIDYSNSAFNLTNGTSVSSFNQISAAIDDRYSKSSSNNRFLQKSLDNTLTGDGTNDNKLGVKTDVIATRDYVNSSFLPTSGGTVSGQLVVSGGSNFDTENLKFIRTGQNGYGRIGLASNGAFAVKVDDSNSNTTQINVAANASYNELIQVQHGGTTAYLIPAVTANTTDGLTNDGILHIILES